MTEVNDQTNSRMPDAVEQAISLSTREIPMSPVELARQTALERATSIHEIDTNDIDVRRVEQRGAGFVAAAEVSSTVPSVEFFDPLDLHQLMLCGRGVVTLRHHTEHYESRSDLNLAA